MTPTEDILSTVLFPPPPQPMTLILALSGDLASGKTTFVQGISRALGIEEKVQSPTFVIAKWYRIQKSELPFRHFVHIDAYRIDSLAEAKHIGLARALRDRDALVVIEWADKIKKLIPKKATWIYFDHLKKNKRRISYEADRPN